MVMKQKKQLEKAAFFVVFFSEIICYWLRRQDSNLRMSAPKADALPLGDASILKNGLEYTDN